MNTNVAIDAGGAKRYAIVNYRQLGISICKILYKERQIMTKPIGYMAGVNLGGWISQYDKYDHEHFKSFIIEDDIKIISATGMDHIRVPVDCPVLEDENRPGAWLNQGFEYLAQCIYWAKKQDMNVIIDLHKAPGFSFGTLDSNTLFTDKAMQARMIALWREIARWFKGEGANVMYELINEVVEPDSSRWNALAQRLIGAVREVDAGHFIVVGGNNYNSVKELKNIAIFDDPKIVYNFHMYEPIIFTHQHASWMNELFEFNRDLRYPSDLSIYRDYVEKYANTTSVEIVQKYEKMDGAFVRDFLQPAVDFQNEYDKPMYCGEYGVIDNADMASRENWSEDVSDFLIEHGIGRAMWSYKEMGFRLVGMDRKAVSDRLVKIYAKR